MPVDFRFVPASGDLSGKSFETQTEQAFNDLGTAIDLGNETAEEAVAVAQNAQSAAISAVNTADAAVGTAQAANQAAQTAIQTSNSATLIAQGASEQSQSAYDLASSAKTQAESAENSAQFALDIAQNAENTAETAEENVTAISVIAENAQSTAETALALAKGIYKTTDARIDADEEVQAKMLYITNPDSLHFPVATPVFFSVYPTDNGTMAIQFCYASEKDPGFFRVSVSLYADPSLNVWGEWKTSSNAIATEEMSGIAYEATVAEAQSGVTNPSRAGAPAFLTPEKGNAGIAALSPALSRTAPRIITAINFNSYKTPGVWAVEPGAHTNAPDTLGGMLTVTATSQIHANGNPVRLEQTYTIWQSGNYSSGIMYTRSLHGDSNVWSPWRSNGFAPNPAGRIQVTGGTAASPYIVPGKGWMMWHIFTPASSGNTPGVWINGVLVFIEAGLTATQYARTWWLPVEKGWSTYMTNIVAGTGIYFHPVYGG